MCLHSSAAGVHQFRETVHTSLLTKPFKKSTVCREGIHSAVYSSNMKHNFVRQNRFTLFRMSRLAVLTKPRYKNFNHNLSLLFQVSVILHKSFSYNPDSAKQRNFLDNYQ